MPYAMLIAAGLTMAAPAQQRISADADPLMHADTNGTACCAMPK